MPNAANTTTNLVLEQEKRVIRLKPLVLALPPNSHERMLAELLIQAEQQVIGFVVEQWGAACQEGRWAMIPVTIYEIVRQELRLDILERLLGTAASVLAQHVLNESS